MIRPSFVVRVISIRSQRWPARGGAIFGAVEVDDRGARIDAKTFLAIKVSGSLLHAPIEIGQLWRVTGEPVSFKSVLDGYTIYETRIDAEEIELIRPSGEHIVNVLALGEAFRGIGYVKARSLWGHFGEELYRLLDQGEVSRLSEVMDDGMARRLVDAWATWGDSFTLQWLQSKGFPIELGRKVANFFGKEAKVKLEEDPYRLISFAADWRTVDDFATRHFEVKPDDSRRLLGALEEVLYSAFDAGHTFLYRREIQRRLADLLNFRELASVDRALQAGEANAAFVLIDDRLHAAGPYLMEQEVAQAISDRALNPATLLEQHEFDAFLSTFAAEKNATKKPTESIQLNARQCDALRTVNTYGVAVVVGGAGTGKTTLLRAVFRLLEVAGYAIYAMALSGRAAKRIREATGQEATTIAGFLKTFDLGDAPDRGVVVVDEASMTDLPSAYRIIRSIPSTYRLVIVGDPHQLPPVGPGLLLHEIVRVDEIPKVELQEIRRYHGAIAQAASSIRMGEWPVLPDEPTADIAFLPCAPVEINELAIKLCEADRDGTQLLCATRNSTMGGTKLLNMQCQKAFNADGKELMLWNDEYEQYETTGLREGDLVLCRKNDWENDLQNGSLGVILEVESRHRGGNSNQCLGRIRWDDELVREFNEASLERLELAYAITIHKAQGSAFRRVIIPVTQSKLLDRTLLYTAITRAEQQVILIGDVDAARRAVLSRPKADARQVALGLFAREMFSRT